MPPKAAQELRKKKNEGIKGPRPKPFHVTAHIIDVKDIPRAKNGKLPDLVATVTVTGVWPRTGPPTGPTLASRGSS